MKLIGESEELTLLVLIPHRLEHTDWRSKACPEDRLVESKVHQENVEAWALGC